MTRRRAAALMAAPLAAAAQEAPAARPARSQPPLCIFSKHLSKLQYWELGEIVKQLGFDGIDLTVRPGGHVVPEKAQVDLLRAIESIRGEGVDIPMITTAVTSVSDPLGRFIIAVAGSLKVQHFKPGYWRYLPNVDIDTRINQVRLDLAGLLSIGKAYNIACGFHNHAGDYVGASVWDARMAMEGLDPRWMGYYFDICHATAEGGEGGWHTSLRMALPRVKMVALKDFYWEKQGGKWSRKMCPLGQGMVDWPRFFSMLAAARFTGPVSLHLEYEPADEVAAMTRDVQFARKQIAAAYAAPEGAATA